SLQIPGGGSCSERRQTLAKSAARNWAAMSAGTRGAYVSCQTASWTMPTAGASVCVARRTLASASGAGSWGWEWPDDVTIRASHTRCRRDTSGPCSEGGLTSRSALGGTCRSGRLSACVRILDGMYGNDYGPTDVAEHAAQDRLP